MAKTGSGFEGTPAGAQAQTTPEDFLTRRDIDNQNTITLHEIQFEQGRISEKSDELSRKIEALGAKIDLLVTQSALSAKEISDISPKISQHHALYHKVIGISIGVSFLVAAIGWVLYSTNASRLDKLGRVLESPGIAKILRQDPK